jgi:hypothetical protein
MRVFHKPDGSKVYRQIAQCACAGENTNCFKCDGTGYYEREVLADPPVEGAVDRLRRAADQASAAEVGFSKDPRGGETYTVREHGRYGSNPLHDDHDG